MYVKTLLKRMGNTLFVCDALEIADCVDVFCDTVDDGDPPGFTPGKVVVVENVILSFVTGTSVSSSSIFVDVLLISVTQSDAVAGVVEDVFSVVLLSEADRNSTLFTCVNMYGKLYRRKNEANH